MQQAKNRESMPHAAHASDSGGSPVEGPPGHPETCRFKGYSLSLGLWAQWFVRVYSRPQKLETGLRTNGAGIPYTLLLRIEAIGFPTFGPLL